MNRYLKKWQRLLRKTKKHLFHRPFFDGKVRAYLTLRCNLQCEFCVNTYIDSGIHLNTYRLLSPDEWINIFNGLNRDIVITGGEPLLYPGLSEIITGVKSELGITIYSNLKVPIRNDISWIKRKGLVFYGSYHPNYGKDCVFVENVRILKQHAVPFTLHAIDVMGREKLEKLFIERLGTDFPKISIDEDQRNLFDSSSKKFKKRVRCRRTIILIAPDGTRYQCVSRMVRRVDPFESMLKESFTGPCREVICNDYGFCAPCDGLGETRQWPIPGNE